MYDGREKYIPLCTQYYLRMHTATILTRFEHFPRRTVAARRRIVRLTIVCLTWRAGRCRRSHSDPSSRAGPARRCRRHALNTQYAAQLVGPVCAYSDRYCRKYVPCPLRDGEADGELEGADDGALDGAAVGDAPAWVEGERARACVRVCCSGAGSTLVTL